MSFLETIDHPGGVRILKLAKPPANAIDEALLGDLNVALDLAADDSAVRAVVLTGSGSFFSGGFDFAAPRREDDDALTMVKLYRDVHVKLLGLAKPTIAMMNGHAVAGGTILVLACDYRLGVEGDYKVGLTEVSVGASFPRAALEIALLRLTHARASEMMLGAALYPASQAIRLGIVDELFPSDSFEATVLRRASRLAAMPREVFAHTKHGLVRPALERIAAESIESELRTGALWLSEESRAARRRIREKLAISTPSV